MTRGTRFTTTVIAAAAFVALLLPAAPANAVVGGTHAAEGQFPFIVSMDEFGCTGSLNVAVME